MRKMEGAVLLIAFFQKVGGIFAKIKMLRVRSLSA